MNVLMIGVDKKSIGGMLTVVENYINNEEFSQKTNLSYIPTVTNSFKLEKITFFLKSLIKIIYVILSKNINIVHVHMAEKGSVFREGLVVLIANALGCKTIIHMHGATIEEWYNNQSNFIKKIVSKIFKKADKIFVLGVIWREFMEKIVKEPSKIEVVYNAVTVPQNKLYNTEAKNIIFLGMLIQRKGIYDLLQAISRIKDKLPSDIKVKLYGADKNNNIYEKINELHLEKKVEYCGWLTNNNKDKCFKNTLINVLPSYNEGLPMTILETMSYGIPNISTNIAAIPEAISNNENGILLKPGDIDSLSNSILKLVSDSDMRKEYSKKSFSLVKEKFDITYHLQKVYRIYCSLLDN